MLPTFVIGLREGLEAALIVSIIAAFLRKQGRSDLLRWVALGVGTAILLCLGVGAALETLSRNLPQRQQEGLETVIGGLAVAMVSYMVIWMRRHSRELKGSLEGAAATAMDAGSRRAVRAMVVMAFLAVLREGFETVVFLFATFNETGSGTPAILGALFGIAVAVGLGWAIYRGGVRLNLSKFFRATGLVLVAVAAGLVVTALHTAHEAGWLNAGQGSTFDLSWLVRPNSVRASLLTGMLGFQDHPVVIEVVGWLAYVIPVGVYVAWPPGRAIAPRRLAIAAGFGGAAAAVAALVMALLAPSLPDDRPSTTAGSSSIHPVSRSGTLLVVRTQPAGAAATDLTMRRVGSATMRGVVVDRYRATVRGDPSSVGTTTMTPAAVAQLNGGRLPLGIGAVGHARIPVSYADATRVDMTIEPRTLRVVDATWTQQVAVTVHAAVGPIPLAQPVRHSIRSLPSRAVSTAFAAARGDVARLHERADRREVAAILAGLAAALLLGCGCLGLVARRRSAPTSTRPIMT